jgi:hypothetical protein
VTNPTPDDVVRMRGVIAEIRGVVESTLNASAPTPGFQSEGARQLVESMSTFGWTEAPFRTCTATIALLIHASVENLVAISRLLDQETVLTPVAVLSRSVFETAARAMWLADQAIDLKTRTIRLYLLQASSAKELARTYQAIAPGPPLSDFGRTMDQLTAWGDTLSLPRVDFDDRRRQLVCGDERLPSYTQSVSTLMARIQFAGGYNITSAISHGELFGLLQAWGSKGDAPSDLIVRRPDRRPLWGAVLSSAVAVAEALWELCSLLGWGARLEQLRSFYRHHNALIASLQWTSMD